MSLNAAAHNPNAASLILSENTDGDYIVQLEGALTGVEAQINESYSPEAYQTAEEFQSLAREHFTESLALSVNGKPISLIDPSVQLGHGTQFTATAQAIPDNIDSIDLTNRFFQDLHGNKMTVIFLPDQFPDARYVLSDDDNYHINLTFADGEWQQNDSAEAFDGASHDHMSSEELEALPMSDDTQESEDNQSSVNTHEKTSSWSYFLGIGVIIISGIIAFLFFRNR